MRVKIPALVAAAGGLFGFLILSPFAMYISHLVHQEIPVREMSVWEVFSPESFLWFLSFTLFGGAIGLVIGILYRGIRERTEKVKEAKVYTDMLLNSMGEGMMTINRDYRIVRANRAFLDQVGEEEENVVGEHCYWISHRLEKPGYEAGVDCPGQQVFATGEPVTAVHVHRNKKNNEFDVEIDAYPIKDSSGNVVQVIEVVRNLTERKKAEEKLRESEERFRKIFEGGPLGMALTGLDFRFVKVNSTLCQMLGYTAQELEGLFFAEITHPGDVAANVQHGRKLLSGEIPIYKTEKRYITKNKEILWVGLTASVVYGKDGKPLYLLALMEDINERKRAEEAIREYAEKLERSNYLKDLFTDIMRHDLLNPVFVIKSLSEILAEDEKFRNSAEIATIRHNVIKLQDMIQNAAKFARVESIGDLEKRKKDLVAVLAFVIDRLRPHYKEKGMKVDLESKGEALAMMNPMLEDVFYNILSNAVKYTPENTTITVDIADEGKSWLVSIADQGEGIPDGYKESIFERFKRQEKKGIKGTGLGLAIAKRTVELHDGRIWVGDNPQGGSMFYVQLPKGR